MKEILTATRWMMMAAAITALLVLLSVWRAAASDCSKTSTGLIPLTDLGASLYKGYQGGLYPEGSNTRPDGHESAGLEIARSIRPLNANGQASDNGRIVLISIGMSNTTQEFSTFKPLADADADKNSKLVIVDGAQGGMTAADISNLDSSKGQQFWLTVDARLAQASVTPAQVQIAWVKEANARPTEGFPQHANKLRDELALIAQILKTRFPNIKLAYYSSRTYAGYASTTLNPEPYAYESGFAVRWLIEDQINGTTGLNFDPSRGEVRAPWIAWGPYLWADGMTPRSDGLVYQCSDFVSDGTHPAPGGARNKVADMLLSFFKTDSTAREWFLEDAGDSPPSVTVETPNGGERYRVGEEITIEWSASDDSGVASQDVLISTNKGKTFERVLASGLTGDVRRFVWIADTPGKARIRIVARDGSGHASHDDSDHNFKIRR
ncbi:MAG: Ig-like domain-containing protein [Acidobacteriota bacterium]